MSIDKLVVKLCQQYGTPYSFVDVVSTADNTDKSNVLASNVPTWNGIYLELPCEASFTDDWNRIACHEIAHWIVSSPEKRKFSDFGLCSVSGTELPHQKTAAASWRQELSVRVANAINGKFLSVLAVQT